MQNIPEQIQTASYTDLHNIVEALAYRMQEIAAGQGWKTGEEEGIQYARDAAQALRRASDYTLKLAEEYDA